MRLKFIDEFRDPAIARGLVGKIHVAWGDRPPMRLMEVCGTHTVSIARAGIRSLLPGIVTMISGPGCPVCVTPDGYIDAAISLGKRPGTIIATFGDMIRVPGGTSSLERERGSAIDARVLYSPLDAVEIAAKNPEKEVVFLGVGFETTAPSIAGAILSAAERGIANFSVLSSVRTIPLAMEVLASDPDVKIEGFLCPAHVSVIIGSNAYLPIAEKFKVPCVVAGFEPLDILYGIYMLLRQKMNGEAAVENEYARVARPMGNGKALGVIARVFRTADIAWRGIGVLPGTGLRISEEFAAFDAEKKFGVEVTYKPEKTACRCGDVLKGKITPPQCPLFGKTCAPEEPYGPCMVSSEGTCAAYFKYGVQ
jgi:hydrogenase expression/formation protein HypD